MRSKLPVITLVAPEGTLYEAPAHIPLVATVKANGNTIDSVQFLQDGWLIGEIWDLPYEFIWFEVGPGRYKLNAKAVYNGDSILHSKPLYVVVKK